MKVTFVIATFAAGFASMTPAVAQSDAPQPSSGSGKIISGAQSSTTTGRSDSLSSKLNKSGGVITPQSDIDPGIKVPAPDPRPGSTPVIPPSATGGNSAK